MTDRDRATKVAEVEHVPDSGQGRRARGHGAAGAGADAFPRGGKIFIRNSNDGMRLKTTIFLMADMRKRGIKSLLQGLERAPAFVI